MRKLLLGFYTPELATLPIPSSSGGMNEPSVYMHFGGLYLSGRFV